MTEPGGPTEQTNRAALRVLVVDDNVDAAHTLAVLLRKSGHLVEEVHDGLSALNAALGFRPDLILLDIGLPVMNGLDVAKNVRTQPELMNVTLVAMTGYGQESDKRQSKEAGFDYHLVKPASFSEIKQILATVAQART